MVLIHFLLGYVYATLLEWAVHKWAYHVIGRKLGTPWNFHYAEHHKFTRINDGYEPGYFSPLGSTQLRESVGLTLAALIHLPLFWLSPAFYVGALSVGVLFAYIHRRSHLDPDFCRTWVPWHWDHHMGPNPEANYGLTSCWVDHLMGTREPYPELRASADAWRKRKAA